jgi:hypothetical protein
LDSAKKAFEAREAERQKKASDADRDFARKALRYAANRLPDVELDESYPHEIGTVTVRRRGGTWDVAYKAVFFEVEGLSFRVYYSRSGSSWAESPILEVKGRREWQRVWDIADIHEAVAEPKKWWQR